MNYITEARRLGVELPLNPKYINGDLFNNGGGRPARTEDGLCIDGCSTCREFRNAVRAALATEAKTASDSWEQGYITALREVRLSLPAQYEHLADLIAGEQAKTLAELDRLIAGFEEYGVAR